MFGQDFFREELSKLVENSSQHRFLLAVSGGVDSMVLLSLFLREGMEFEVAHINYKLRGQDSEGDEHLVKNFCEEHHIPTHVYHVSEKDCRPEGSIQEWARNLRYDFFRKIMNERNLDFLVTAHHLNDQLETFFINLSRGTGLAGLAGMPRNENQILRPLLRVEKRDLYAYVEKNKIPFREDQSNFKNDYLRNKIRNKIVPELLNVDKFFLRNFEKTISIVEESRTFIKSQIKEILSQITISNDFQELILDKKKLSEKLDFIKYELLKEYGFSSKKEIEKMFLAQTGSLFYSDEYVLLVNRDEFIIQRKIKEEISEEIVLEELKDGDLRRFNSFRDRFSEEEWCIDGDKISFPLRLRKQKKGDFFYPKGMKNQTKKISKFFKNEKLSIFEKSKVWILSDAENQIVGIIPFRQDGRFVVNEKTKNIIKIKI